MKKNPAIGNISINGIGPGKSKSRMSGLKEPFQVTYLEVENPFGKFFSGMGCQEPLICGECICLYSTELSDANKSFRRRYYW